MPQCAGGGKEAASLAPAGRGRASRYDDITNDCAGRLRMRKTPTTSTMMTVTFNPLRLELTEAGDCVSEATVSRLKGLGLIDPDTVERLEPATH